MNGCSRARSPRSTICRKTAGGGGFAINIMGIADSLAVKGKKALRIYRAEIRDDDGRCRTSTGERHFCGRCASALWLCDPQWSDLVPAQLSGGFRRVGS